MIKLGRPSRFLCHHLSNQPASQSKRLQRPRLLHYDHAATLNFSELTSRKVLQVSGKDAFSYIQMLTTNNLQQTFNCLNSYMTTPNSKILCDLLIYKVKGDVFEKELILNGLTGENYGKKLVDCLDRNETIKETNADLIDELRRHSAATADDEEVLYLECDRNLVDSLRKTLFVRNLGNDVKFEILNDQKVYAVYPTVEDYPHSDRRPSNSVLNRHVTLNNEFMSSYFICVNDPRLPFLGQRVITKLPEADLLKILDQHIFLNCRLRKAPAKNYRLNRYKLGVGEGLKEHRMAATLLPSFNGDFLNGANLYKGGFLGQTPLNRILNRQYKFMRRLLPFRFFDTDKKIQPTNLPTGIEFLNKDDRPIGEYIDSIGNFGIGYFKLNSFVHLTPNRYITLKVTHNEETRHAIVLIPFWWPSIQKQVYLSYEDELSGLKEELSKLEETFLPEEEYELADDNEFYSRE